ncbi:hypothetical protein M422DRAFT_45981 [Sphaerobolus stellatus SS14]|uniref:Uncharacterized protein n=1 Tax=Sphaerobolus stellatus (strain SS14) TaxID=990650 RepID=A0A0C9W3V6_SPHS4|nr:hypothetical protein M422DRAFT_45981 [Sphaerobolus stellatus SS14]
MLPKHADGLSINPHACVIGIYLAVSEFHLGEDEDEPSNSPHPQSPEIFQKLDIDNIAHAIRENTRCAIFSTFPGTSVPLAYSEQSQLENITSSASAFHHIGNIELHVS